MFSGRLMIRNEVNVMTMIVERIEDDLAVIEETDADGAVTLKKLPLDWLPEDVSEGDVLIRTKDGLLIDRAETEKRRRSNAARFSELTGNDGL